MNFFKKKSPENSKNAKELMDFLGCPCEYINGGKSRAEIMTIYKNALAEGRQNGFTPLLFVLEDIPFDLPEYENSADFRRNFAPIENFDPQKWLSDRVDGDPEYYSDDLLNDSETDKISPEKLASHDFESVIPYGKKSSVDLLLAKIPETEPWKIFGWIPFGGWNDCPSNEEIMGMAEYWHKKFGIIPAVMTHDILEFSAPLVPENEAEQLAREQCIFCPDIVYQGVGSLKALEESLKRSTVWYFWWD